MNKKTAKQIEFLLNDATKYVEILEKELTPAAASNAYYALCEVYKADEKQNLIDEREKLRERYNAACEKVNERFPC